VLQDEMPGKFDFEKVDVTANLDLAKKYYVSATPTLVVLDPAGQTIDIQVGVPPKETLESALKEAGAK
jgi:protein-disulfide isomerase